LSHCVIVLLYHCVIVLPRVHHVKIDKGGLIIFETNAFFILYSPTIFVT
jgi:hypothetical protein